MYTDGSKDQEKNLAGAGVVTFDEENSLILNKGLKIDHRLSIYTCEMSAIDYALDWLKKMDRNWFKASNISLHSIRLFRERETETTFTWIPSHWV